MIVVSIFVPLALLWAGAVWHLSDPAHRADAMPAPPSAFTIAAQAMMVGIRAMSNTLRLELMPVLRTAADAVAEFGQEFVRSSRDASRREL